MKAPRFWYPPLNEDCSPLLGNLLAPFSALFVLGGYLRRSFAKPYHPKRPLICIGNAVVGGAGKTPTAIAIARILSEAGHKPAFISKGYGGNLKTVTHVDPARHTANDVGDEALLLANHAPTWAGRDRAAAVRQAENHASLLVMDDGLQNPHITPSVSFLVIDGEAGIGNGHILPAGPLREAFDDALSRVAAVILIGPDLHNLASRIKKPLFRARLQQTPLPAGFPREGRFVAFAGIARPEKFYATARTAGLDIADTIDFADHHSFSASDIDMLRLRAEEKGAHLLTTTKDAVRLPKDFLSEIFTLPVELVFEGGDAESRVARLAQGLPY